MLPTNKNRPQSASSSAEETKRSQNQKSSINYQKIASTAVDPTTRKLLQSIRPWVSQMQTLGRSENKTTPQNQPGNSAEIPPNSATLANTSQKKTAWGNTTAHRSDDKTKQSDSQSEKSDQKDHPVENNSSASNADHDDQHNPWCTAGKNGRQNLSNYNRSEGNKQPRTGQYNSQDLEKIQSLHEEIETLKKLMKKKPKDPVLNARIAKLYSEVGNSEMATHHNRIGHESGDPNCSLFFAIAHRKKEDENSLKEGSLILKSLLDEKSLKDPLFIDLAQRELLLIYIKKKDFEQALPLANKIIDGNTSKSAKKEADNKTLLLAEHVKTAFNIKLDRLDRQQATPPLNTNANNQQTQDDGTKKNRCSKEDTYRFMKKPGNWFFYKLFDPGEVIEILEELIPEYRDPQLYLKLKDACKKKGDDKLTVYYSELAFKRFGDIRSAIHYAQAFIMKGDAEKAKQILQNTLLKEEIKNMPYEKYFAQEQLMKCYNTMGEHEEALALSKKIIRIYEKQREQDTPPDIITVKCTNITSLMKLNRQWDQEANKLYAQHPNNYIVIATLTQAYIENGNIKKARELIGHFYKTINIETVEEHNRFIKFKLKEAKCHECLKEFNDAEAIYKWLLNKYPNNFKIVFSYTNFLQNSRNNLKEAEKILKTLRNKPEQISDNLQLEVRILRCQGKKKPMKRKVFDFAKQLNEHFKNNPNITYTTASIYFQAFILTGENIFLQKAWEQAEISYKLRRNNALCIRLLAHIYRSAGLNNKASEYWDRAEALDNKHGDNRPNEQQESWQELEAQRRKGNNPEQTGWNTSENLSSLKTELENEIKEQNKESASPSGTLQVESFQNDNPVIQGNINNFDKGKYSLP